METLHTILLGPYKYLLRMLMGRLTSVEKNHLQARLETFDFSSLQYKMSYNLIRHFRSRDFKSLAQVSLFLLGPLMTTKESLIWLALSKVIHHTHFFVLLLFFM